MFIGFGNSRFPVFLGFLLVASLPPVQAQITSAAASPHKFAVTVHDLRIPTKAAEAYNRGIKYLTNGDAAGSLSYFQRATRAFPGFYEAYYNQGVAQMQLDRESEAIESFQKAIDLSDGHFARAYFAYALLLNRQGKNEDAESVVRRGLSEDSGISDGYTVLSIVLFDRGRLDEAEEAAHKSLRLPDASAKKALVTLAHIHLRRGEYQLAVQDLEEYLKGVRAGTSKPEPGIVEYLERKLRDAKEKSASLEANNYF